MTYNMQKTNLKLIGISGKKRSGKDTFYKTLKAIYPHLNYQQESFAKPLKKIISELTNRDISKLCKLGLYDHILPCYNITVRQFMQNFAGTCRTHFDKDIWIKSLESRIDRSSNYIITDVRHINEAEWIKKYNGILIRVERPNMSVDMDVSETQLDDYQGFDYIVYNNSSLEEYEYKVVRLLKSLIGEKNNI